MSAIMISLKSHVHFNVIISSKWQVLSGLTQDIPSTPAPATIPPSEGHLLLFIPPVIEGELDIPPPLIDHNYMANEEEEEVPLPPSLEPISPPVHQDPLLSDMSAPSAPIPVPTLRRRSFRPLFPDVPYAIHYLPLTWSDRVCPLSAKFNESIDNRMSRTYSAYYDAHHQDNYLLQDSMTDPISFAAKTDPHSMYYHQAIREPNCRQFINTMVDELNDHIKRGHWSLVPLSSVPPNTRILVSICTMKRKRDIISRKVYKWKARIHICALVGDMVIFTSCAKLVYRLRTS